MSPEGTLRDRNRRQAYAEISATAMRLFAEQEDIVVGDLVRLGAIVRDALVARPPEEDPWQALTAALAALADAPGKPAAALETALLTSANPTLRARHLEKHLRWQELLVPEIERRMGLTPGPVPDPRAHAIVGACL